jgi:hypothetical protein
VDVNLLRSFIKVLLKKTEDLRGKGRRLKHLGCRRFGGLDLKRKRMESQTGKAHLIVEKLERPGSAVARIAHYGMAGKPRMAPDLMFAAGQKITLNEGVMGASAKNPEAGFAPGCPSRAFRMEAAPRLL